MVTGKDVQKIKKKLAKAQDGKRFEHTISVSYTAAALAMRYRLPVAEAYLAGLLHDCAKCLPDKKLLQICEKNGLGVSETERRNPYLLHGRAGAYLAKTEYDIQDEDILHAICFHTTGRMAMSELEKIVFIADYIEPGRKKAKNLEEIRALAFESLDLTIVKILENTLAYLNSTSGEIDEMSVKTLEYYRERTGA